jgi:alkylation response protein AidB-like acyl-CoA dehydrogenase
MEFQFTEEQLAVRDAAREFAKTELLPGVIQRDEEQKFPTEQVKKMADLGFLGMIISPEWEGSGMDTVTYVLALEELSKIDASASVIMSVNNSLVCAGLEKYASDAQKEKGNASDEKMQESHDNAEEGEDEEYAFDSVAFD